MSMIFFDSDEFRIQFPEFNDEANEALQLYFNNATLYIENNYSSWSGVLKPIQKKFALYLLTAHLLYLHKKTIQGQIVGAISDAKIDKVEISLVTPPISNQFRYWLQSSNYGQQLIALLYSKTTGGKYISPRNLITLNAVRR